MKLTEVKTYNVIMSNDKPELICVGKAFIDASKISLIITPTIQKKSFDGFWVVNTDKLTFNTDDKGFNILMKEINKGE